MLEQRVSMRKSRAMHEAPVLMAVWAKGAMAIISDTIVPVNGDPVATPENAEQVLKNISHCHGFCGASSKERMPAEVALTAQTKRLKQISR